MIPHKKSASTGFLREPVSFLFIYYNDGDKCTGTIKLFTFLSTLSKYDKVN